MQKLILFFSFCLFVSACSDKNEVEKSDGTPVGKALQEARKSCPEGQFDWLEEIIVKAEEDKSSFTHKGNYIGWIGQTEYDRAPVFMVMMMMGSGGIMYYLYNCDGSRVTLRDNVLPSPSEKGKRIIYTNVPLDL